MGGGLSATLAERVHTVPLSSRPPLSKFGAGVLHLVSAASRSCSCSQVSRKLWIILRCGCECERERVCQTRWTADLSRVVIHTPKQNQWEWGHFL